MNGTTVYGITGDVTIGPDNRVHRMAYQLSIEYGGHLRGLLDVVTMELSDFGTPVAVERPRTY